MLFSIISDVTDVVLPEPKSESKYNRREMYHIELTVMGRPNEIIEI